MSEWITEADSQKIEAYLRAKYRGQEESESAMSERITEAELLDVERACAPVVAYTEGVTEREANLGRGVLRYIEEVRRLRGIILTMETAIGGTIDLAPQYVHNLAENAPAFFEEALAIVEEQR